MQIYLVGGAVRDALLGYPVYDRDWVVVGATPQQMLDQGFKPVGSDFPVLSTPTLARNMRWPAPSANPAKAIPAFSISPLLK